MAKKAYVNDGNDWVELASSNTDLSGYLLESSASTTYATKTELNNIDLSSASAAAVAAIVDSAPSTLNTLNELAAALGDDANYASTITTALGNKLDISTASSTYLTQASASSSFALKNSPAFSAWNSTVTSIGAGATVKVGFQTEVFDTNSNFDTTLSRFTPTVAGYYQVSALVTLYLATAGVVFTPILYKNGSGIHFGGTAFSSAINFPRANISALVYANGTTDYFEIFAGHSMGTAVDTYNVQNQTFFQAAYVRGI
jgi:hypothetical protein